MAQEKTTEVTKIDSNNFEVAETITTTRRVEKKELKNQIDDLEALIADTREKSGLNALEADLAMKKELLKSLK